MRDKCDATPALTADSPTAVGRTVVRAVLGSLPAMPGVHRMVNAGDEALYVGESTNELITELQELAKRRAQLPKNFCGGGRGELPRLKRELIRDYRDRHPHVRANVFIKVVHKS